MFFFFCVYGIVNIFYMCLSLKEIDIFGCEIDNLYGYFYKIYICISISLVFINIELRDFFLFLNLNS